MNKTNDHLKFKSYMNIRNSKIAVHPCNIPCLMCLEKMNRKEFVQVTNKFITELYGVQKGEYRLKLVVPPVKQLFQDMNDFKDRVTTLMTDYNKEEDNVPNYFRNLIEYKGGLYQRWLLMSEN